MKEYCRKSLIPLALAGLFLFFKTSFEANQYRILISTGDTMSIKDSILFFQNKVNRMERIGFISNMCFFYMVAIGVSCVIINDKGAINLFNEMGMIPFLIILIILLLSVPWFIRYLYQRKYKKLFFFLKKNLDNEY